MVFDNLIVQALPLLLVWGRYNFKYLNVICSQFALLQFEDLNWFHFRLVKM